MRFLLCLATASIISSVNAYFILNSGRLAAERIDPIVNPGAVSSHVHNIIGASNININSTYDSLQTSRCTTVPVTVDKSAYWQPMLYWYNLTDQTYHAINSHVNAYYLQRPGPKNEKIYAPPKGLRILAGDPFRKSYNAGNFADQAVNYVCQDFAGGHQGDPEWLDRPNFFNHGCPDGMRAQVVFPACWNGVDLYKTDGSHMAYPIQAVNTGDCPVSHPVHIITHFQEFVYDVDDFPFNGNGSINWVWANGDTTGYGLHADFMNGWDIDVLQAAVDQCTGQIGGVLKDCPPFVPYLDYDAAAACKIESQIVDENVGLDSTLKALPGCNPLWSEGPKPTCPPIAIPGFKSPVSTPAAGYTYQGCIAESTSGRALTGATLIASNMTAAVCTTFCASQSMAYSGVEYGDECYCGSSFSNGASNATIATELCGVTCAGNENESCGGSRTLSLYANPSLVAAKPPSQPAPGYSYFGCLHEPKTGRLFTGAATTSSKNMSAATCTAFCATSGFEWAGVEYGIECYCGSRFSNGGSNTPLPDSQCSMPCSGAADEKCGSGSILSVYRNPANRVGDAPALPLGWKSVGCYQDSTSSRTLKEYTYANRNMTIDSCVATCSAKGFGYAGLEYGQECYCGSSLPTSQVSNNCNMGCAGDKRYTCGGSAALSVFSNVQVTSPGYVYQGCVKEASNGRLLIGASTTSDSMTADVCTSFCAQKGHQFSGVEYGQECYCGSFFNGGSPQTLDASQCRFPCSGDSNSICGGYSTLSLYRNAALAPAPEALPAGWTASGCFTDMQNSTRALSSFTFASSNMTAYSCTQTCQARGYALAGTEYSAECYCGNALQYSVGSTACSMPCSGAPGYPCGGSAALSVYTYSNTTSLSSRAVKAASVHGARALNGKSAWSHRK